MAEKEINERRRGLLKRVLESKTLNRTLKTVVLSAFLSGKAMSSKAVEPQVKDAAVDAVEQKTEAMPSQRLSENYAKLQKFADFPELSPAQAAFVDHTYIVERDQTIYRTDVLQQQRTGCRSRQTDDKRRPCGNGGKDSPADLPRGRDNRRSGGTGKGFKRQGFFVAERKNQEPGQPLGL